MQMKPVKFIAVACNVSAAEAVNYQRETGLGMTLFADNLGVLQQRFGFKVSLRNIWQYRILDASGRNAGGDLSEKSIENALARAAPEPKYMDLDVGPKLAPVLHLLEFNQYAAGTRLLGLYRKTANKAGIASANKIQTVIKQEAEVWHAEAQAASDPVAAYDRYSRVANVMPTDSLGKASQEKLKSLASDKSVKAELAARAAFNKVAQAMSIATMAQRPVVAKAFQDIAKKHAGTPTAEKAQTLAEELTR